MTTPQVRILEDRVVDQIAAGEVVERPASVVKELVENALDARATRVVVALKDGGREAVRVEDDGHGMTREDALSCIERHATSKIRSAEDLSSVATFGFRGEALPSIAAVSRFVLLTRAPGASVGTKLRMESGRLMDVREAAAAPGTVAEALALFHAQPARRAFLRSAETELAHCQEAVVRIALARPDVAFVVRHGSRVVLQTEPTPDLGARATDLLGRATSEFRSIEGERGGLRLGGVVAPGVHRAEAGRALYLYVNGRWVRDLVIRRAVATAFRDLVPPGRHPVVVLSLSLPPGSVDVNVHPTKAEVRFREPATVAAFVAEVLRSELRARVAASSPAGRARPKALPALPFVATTSPDRATARLPTDVPTVGPHPVVLPPRPEAQLAAEPGLDGVPEHVATLRERYLLLADADVLVVLDGGRLRRRVQVAGLDGASVRLLAPVIVHVSPGASLDEELLDTLGLRTSRLSPTEVVVRSVPTGLVDADPAELVHLAAGQVDPRNAWADRLAIAPVVDGRRLLEDARRLGLALRPVVGTVGLAERR